MISQNTIQQILGRIDIIDVVGGFVKLKKEGLITLVSALFIMKRRPPLLYRLQRKSTSVLVAAAVVIPSVSSWSMKSTAT